MFAILSWSLYCPIYSVRLTEIELVRCFIIARDAELTKSNAICKTVQLIDCCFNPTLSKINAANIIQTRLCFIFLDKKYTEYFQYKVV